LENRARWNSIKKLIAACVENLMLSWNNEEIIEIILAGLIKSKKLIGTEDDAREALAKGWQTFQKNERDGIDGLSCVSIMYNYLVMNNSLIDTRD
jgi:hypothetical protein